MIAWKFANITLRAVTLAARLLLMLLLAKFLHPYDVGLYGIFSATVSYCIFFVGFDFYNYSNRELISMKPERRGQALKSQICVSAILYTFFTILFFTFSAYVEIPAEMMLWFIPLLCLEHLNQEIYRILTVLSRQTIASTCLFIRQGSWVLALAFFWTLGPEKASLQQTFTAWAISSLVAAIVGLQALRRESFGGWLIAIDWTWVWRGVKTSVLLLSATLALRGIQTADRYFLNAITNLETVAAYVLFLGISASLLAMLDAGLFSYAYPRFLILVRENQTDEITRSVRILLLQTIFWCALFAFSLYLFMPCLFELIGKEVYLQQQELFWWVLLAAIIYAISLVPHYALYALGMDRAIAYSSFLGLASFLLSAFLLTPVCGSIAIPLSTGIGFAAIASAKAFWYLKSFRFKQ